MTSGRPRAVQALELLAILGFAALWVKLALRLGGAVEQPSHMLLLVPVAVAGYLAADFVTGVTHWFCDTFFEEDSPVIGALVIRPFREHHRDPLAMTRHGVLEINGNSCVALLPVLAMTQAAPVDLRSLLGLAWSGFGAAFFLGVAVTNRLHGWAHDTSAPAGVRRLQVLGVILSPARHARHHRAPYAQAYCVTHGWLNPVLDRTRFFDRATRVLERLGLPRTRALESQTHD